MAPRLNLPESYNIDKFTKTRNNQDLHINSYGEKLINFAISTKLRILNGRTLGDLMGKFTYIGYNGVSVVDYTLASENFIMKNYIYSFSIEALTTLFFFYLCIFIQDDDNPRRVN